MIENNWRSLTKAATYRITGTCWTVLIALFVTGQWPVAFTIGALEIVVKVGLYWGHERAWNLISWGCRDKNQKRRSDNELRSVPTVRQGISDETIVNGPEYGRIQRG